MFFQLLSVLINRKTSEKELELMRRIVLKEENALSELYDMYAKLLYSLIIRIVKNQEEAEEILQNIFLQVWYKAGSFDSQKGSIYSWLITLARNKSIDRIRSKRFKEQSRHDEISAFKTIDIEKQLNSRSDMDISFIIDTKERAAIVSKALNELPAEQKKVIEMAYYEGFSQVEISDMLNVPLGTVKTRTRQALLKLEIMLQKIL